MRKLLLALILFAGAAAAQTRVWPMPGKSPLITFRIVFTTGAASDPAEKPGVAHLTAAMLAEGGTGDLAYKQIVDMLYPLATRVSYQVDKEMTTFSAVTHADNVDRFYQIFRAMLLEPGWREDDLRRLRDEAINFLRVGLRGANDEELGKEVLYNVIYEGHPYGRHNAGTVSSLEKITLDDLKRFYRQHYTQANLMIGLAGGYTPKFLARIKQDFKALPAEKQFPARITAPKPIERTRAVIVEKDTRSVAYSIGFPISVVRSDADYVPLLVAQTYLGQHRQSGGRLYQRMRELRGLNYGDYAYIEYFPEGMFRFEPSPNLARHQQIFQIWIRPVEPPTAHFALRLALYELDKLVKEGISEQDFQQTRDFLLKYVNLLMKTKSAELGYRLDSLFYGLDDYRGYLENMLKKISRAWVNNAIKTHLRADRLVIVAVSKDAEELKKRLASGEPSPMTYNAAKPDEILQEDKVVERWNLGLRPEDISIIPVEKVFE